MTPPDAFDAVIVGGGAAGVLAAIHLLEDSALRVAIVEPRGSLAHGVAYSTAHPEHLLNVVAARMSALDARPDDFVAFLLAQPGADDRPAAATCFAERRVYGRYLAERLRAQPGYGGLVRLHDAVVRIGRGDAFALQLASGRRLDASNVVLAMGNAPRALPVPSGAIDGTPRVIGAWDYDAVRAIGLDDAVCILGSGLSMVDAVLSLVRSGHRASITVLSRHGLSPLGHVDVGYEHMDVPALLALGIRARMRALRGHAAAAQADGRPWQWTMDAVRQHVPALWQSLDVREQRRFLRHAARFWDIHRHRIAPQAASQLDGLRRSGQLRVHAGRLLGLVGDAQAVRVRYRPRHATGPLELHAACVINATGVETSIDRQGDSLYARMRVDGLVQPGPHGIGIATGPRGEVLDARRAPVGGLYTLGASRIGEQWESIAVPELRMQAAQIAAAVRSGAA